MDFPPVARTTALFDLFTGLATKMHLKQRCCSQTAPTVNCIRLSHSTVTRFDCMPIGCCCKQLRFTLEAVFSV